MKLSRDQKRKKKLAARKKHGEIIQAYAGKKYHTDQYVPIHAATETAILEAYLGTERQLDDRQVVESLERLIRELRGEVFEAPAARFEGQTADGRWDDLVVCRIRDHWLTFFSRNPPLARHELCGVLRSILHSISIWHQKGGYLPYVERFLGRAGIRLHVRTKDVNSEAGVEVLD